MNDPIKMYKWQEKYKRYCNKIEEFNSGKKKLYTLLWGQCTQIMKNELQAVDEFEEMDDDQDPISLIKNIKKITNSFRDRKYVFGSMWYAQKQLYNCIQKEDEDIKKYYDRYKILWR